MTRKGSRASLAPVSIPTVSVPGHPEWPPLSAEEEQSLREEIKRHLARIDGVLVAHYYTDGLLQDLAEETGGCVADSLEMARFGRDQGGDTLVVAGVRFMGETAKILSPLSHMEEHAAIAAWHHERWDGKGYPEGIAGESIPIEGRITAISDVFDALTTVRPYKFLVLVGRCRGARPAVPRPCRRRRWRHCPARPRRRRKALSAAARRCPTID